MSQMTKLTASDGAAWDGLGRSVSISGDIVVVGAPRNDGNGSRSGSAYIFSKTVYNGIFFPIKSKSGNTVIIYLE